VAAPKFVKIKCCVEMIAKHRMSWSWPERQQHMFVDELTPKLPRKLPILTPWVLVLLLDYRSTTYTLVPGSKSTGLVKTEAA
jgi:hypothetical protein